jgi:phosphatidylserine decarboxylase
MLMTLRSTFHQLMRQERLNFLLTNRVPRILLTRFMGWFSKIEHPWVRDLSIGVWRRFADLHLEEARKPGFTSMHDCFIRELKPGARPIDADPAILTSPCDGIVGACGAIDGVRIFQAKGFPYTMLDLLGDPDLAMQYRNGCYATIRITSSMYHRFHAPLDCRVRQVDYISGDTWNVNPIALKRVENLFCRNERAVIQAEIPGIHQRLLLVPVAAILVASMRFHFLDVLLHLKYRGPNRIACDASFNKGDELGWFQHGSTIIVIAPVGFTLSEGIAEGSSIRMGERLMRLPQSN